MIIPSSFGLHAPPPAPLDDDEVLDELAPPPDELEAPELDALDDELEPGAHVPSERQTPDAQSAPTRHATFEDEPQAAATMAASARTRAYGFTTAPSLTTEHRRAQQDFVHRNTARFCYASSVIEIKKYTNRRLYDTEASHYITLEELAEKIRRGADVRVSDAKTGEDLTQATLTQIILESRRAARLLPIPMLVQLIRMGDDALAEFFGRYMSGALELYLSAKSGAQALAPLNPFATVPFTATNALARLLLGGSPFSGFGAQPEPPPPPPPREASPPPAVNADVEGLRRELEELKRSLKGAVTKKRRS